MAFCMMQKSLQQPFGVWISQADQDAEKRGGEGMLSVTFGILAGCCLLYFGGDRPVFRPGDIQPSGYGWFWLYVFFSFVQGILLLPKKSGEGALVAPCLGDHSLNYRRGDFPHSSRTDFRRNDEAGARLIWITSLF